MVLNDRVQDDLIPVLLVSVVCTCRYMCVVHVDVKVLFYAELIAVALKLYNSAKVLL